MSVIAHVPPMARFEVPTLNDIRAAAARIGIGMHQRRAGFALHFGARLLARCLGRRATMQDPADAFDVGELGRDGALGHHDVRGDFARSRRQRQRRTVVAGRVRHDAAPGFVIFERPHGVAGTAELE
jgi:hypothetical protein